MLNNHQIQISNTKTSTIVKSGSVLDFGYLSFEFIWDLDLPTGRQACTPYKTLAGGY
jgi:hypothetical protein